MLPHGHSDRLLRRRRWQVRLVWTLGGLAIFTAGVWVFGHFALPPLREGAVQELIQAARQSDDQRMVAAVNKVRFHRADERAASELVQLWNGGDWALDLRVAKALNRLGAKAVPALLGSIEDKTSCAAVTPHDLVRWARSARHPSAVGRLCDVIIGHPDSAVRRTLIEALATLSPGDQKERYSLVFADETDDQAVADPSGRLGVFGPAAVRVQESLCIALQDADPMVRAAAAQALSRFRPRDSSVWDALKLAVEDEDVSVRVNAAYALAMIDNARAAFVLPTALAALSGADPANHLHAACAVSAVDPVRFPEVWPTLNALLLSLQDDEPGLREPVLAIWSFGAHATPAVPDLIRIVKRRRSDFGLSVRALTAIGVAANDTRVEAFFLAQVDDAAWQRRCLWELVGFARNGSQRSLGALRAALSHEDYETRYIAATCLGVVGPPAKAAIPDLQRALRDDNEVVRREAAEALEKISPRVGAGQGNGASSP